MTMPFQGQHNVRIKGNWIHAHNTRCGILELGIAWFCIGAVGTAGVAFGTAVFCVGAVGTALGTAVFCVGAVGDDNDDDYDDDACADDER